MPRPRSHPLWRPEYVAMLRAGASNSEVARACAKATGRPYDASMILMARYIRATLQLPPGRRGRPRKASTEASTG